MAVTQLVPEQTRLYDNDNQHEQWVDQIESEDGLKVSEAVYWEKYYEKADYSYEWNNGYLELKPMSDYQQYSLYGWFVTLLRCYLTVEPIAKIIALEVGFRLALAHKMTIRKPDLFVIRHDNPIAMDDIDRSYRGICDLAVESLSDSTRKEVERDTVDKKAEYAAAGVNEYYILDARRKHLAFYRLNPQKTYDIIQPAADNVIQSSVLPGFQFRVDDLYRQPSPIEMAEDPVYQAFVLPEYQVEKRRAERLAARLRALGLDDE